MNLDWDGLVRQFEELGMTLVLSQDKRSYALGMQQNGGGGGGSDPEMTYFALQQQLNMFRLMQQQPQLTFEMFEEGAE